MDKLNLVQLLLTVASAVVGAGFVSYLARFLIVSYIRQNDEKHKAMGKVVQKICIDLEVIKTRIGDALRLHEDVREHDRKIVCMLKDTEQLQKDVDHCHNKIRDIQTTLSDHEIRIGREASGG